MKLLKQTFEIRFERGYRYFDHCGEVMIIFEDLLPEITGQVWMPQEIVPSGAKLKCPELDVYLVFDATRLIVDQDPCGKDFDFPSLASMAYATISGRFDLKTVIRVGFRQFYMSAVDTVEEAESLSLKHVPLKSTWPGVDTNKLRPRSLEAVGVFEAPDESEGCRIAVGPQFRKGAPDALDERLLSRPRFLPKGQKEALISQLQRASQRDKNPLVGLSVDVDYYWTRPARLDLKLFFEKAMAEAVRQASGFMR